MMWLAVDPGMADMGVLVLDGRAIIAARTLKTTGDGPVPSFDAALDRAAEQAHALVSIATEHGVGLVVCEGYQDFGGGHKRGVKHRWTTPLVLMAIHLLMPAGVKLVWQPPATVLTCYREHMAAWKAGVRGMLPGDAVVTNAHLRSAGSHALAYLDREGEPR